MLLLKKLEEYLNCGKKQKKTILFEDFGSRRNGSLGEAVGGLTAVSGVVMAKDCPRGYPWEFLLAAGDWVQEDCIKVRKVLSTLAWHLSTRENRQREFVWCRDAAAMVQGLLRRWRHEPRKACDSVQITMPIQ